MFIPIPNSMDNRKSLHIVMFPWLAMGHFIPFFRLSKLLALKGHKISFVSTTGNLSKLPKIPSNLSSHMTLISFPLPPVPNLPYLAESSMDITDHNQQQSLKHALDLLKPLLSSFLQSSKPDWIIYDYASYWLPSVAAQLGVSRAFFAVFSAACLSFMGSPSTLIGSGGDDARSTGEDFTKVPSWVPFESNLAYRLHEIIKYFQRTDEDNFGPPDTVRFGVTIQESEVVVVRSSAEFEPEWLDLLGRLYEKPVMPVGFLPPIPEELDDILDDEKWVCVRKWLDEQRVNSVVYVAMGLSKEELGELANGLEESGLPFFWVLKNTPGTSESELEMQPDGFKERVKGRGFLYLGWAPQVKILSHESIGGFLTHCGWNSVIEALRLGRVLIMLPMLNDQGLNVRLFQNIGVGLEIPRNQSDGWFTSEVVAESVRAAVLEESGKGLREMAKAMKGCFGDPGRNGGWVDKFVSQLEDYGHRE
ncbi:UDP-glycosyltransferase 91C1 [Hibiscus syriacus]|uniref:UDP-glycosyltransferase 91C1 n=1 Tax=Hibiscus syriacus TaxID=106335 RepID=A0A6A3AHV2_HIBSY|nr:UDP-glycosyltransferase 91C1 [Hibiscus syriacus]KAE8703217.1 UDP-glycosyltransferase 91C1 [Hibiscus syriacus]